MFLLCCVGSGIGTSWSLVQNISSVCVSLAVNDLGTEKKRGGSLDPIWAVVLYKDLKSKIILIAHKILILV
jgi:hypothetical protein